ncbi:hypothetical protein X747_14595 [Mesorhizobium sp. LNJC384A00]|uniref:hypothetical protein n=1 Tax=Mesorhizobium sp. LNJC384A00 TaxID=1287268 RepID=UPI0003CE8E67|nr:hypothetical protein [Mesorhizobium sp. LNJC384A00]ESY42023.1 hypothetical protein X747_14595 [Mesorhizobium sp. LNJC384A00]
MRVNVYDSINPKRLLGTICTSVLPFGSNGHEHCRMAVCSPAPYCYYRDVPISFDATVHTVTFTRRKAADEVPGTHGWQRQDAVSTDAPLNHLVTIRSFRLPDESDRQADIRNRYR